MLSPLLESAGWGSASPELSDRRVREKAVSEERQRLLGVKTAPGVGCVVAIIRKPRSARVFRFMFSLFTHTFLVDLQILLLAPFYATFSR